MKSMVLAAGEGIRLRPLTQTCPKPMLLVANRPILEHTVLWLRQHGVTQIAMNLHYHPEAVTRYFGDGSKFAVELKYSYEDKILGTAGGVKRLAGFFDSTFVVVYGDVLTDLDLEALVDFHFERAVDPHVTMSLYRVPNPGECGIVCLGEKSRVVQFVEKPAAENIFSDLANAGVFVIDLEILKYIPKGRFYDFGHELFPDLLRRGIPIFGWMLPEEAYLLDIGSPARYAQAQREWPTPAAQKYLAQGVKAWPAVRYS